MTFMYEGVGHTLSSADAKPTLDNPARPFAHRRRTAVHGMMNLHEAGIADAD
jgi:hypothetical protein